MKIIIAVKQLNDTTRPDCLWTLLREMAVQEDYLRDDGPVGEDATRRRGGHAEAVHPARLRAAWRQGLEPQNVGGLRVEACVTGHVGHAQSGAAVQHSDDVPWSDGDSLPLGHCQGVHAGAVYCKAHFILPHELEAEI